MHDTTLFSEHESASRNLNFSFRNCGILLSEERSGGGGGGGGVTSTVTFSTRSVNPVDLFNLLSSANRLQLSFFAFRSAANINTFL